MSSKDAPKDPPTHMPDRDRPAPPAPPEAPAAPPAAPPIVEYPKMLYHPDGRVITVQTKDEEAKATKDGFEDTPTSPEKPAGKRPA
jgi:hypothetical protein